MVAGLTLLCGLGLMCGKETRANRMFVVNPADSSLSLVNLEDMKVERTITVGANPYYAAVSGDGSVVAVTIEDEDVIRYYDTKTLEQTGEHKFGVMKSDHLMTLNDGSYAVMADNVGNAVVFLDFKTRDVAFRVENISSPHNIQLGPSGKYLYVTSKVDPGISIIDIEKKELAKWIKTDVVPRGLTVSPDEKTLYYGARWISGMFVLDVATKDVRLIQFPLPRNATEMQSNTYHTFCAVNDSIIIGVNEGFSSADVINTSSNSLMDRFEEVSNPSTVSPIPGRPYAYVVTNYGDNTAKVIVYNPEDHTLSLESQVQVGSVAGTRPKRVCFFTS